MLTFLGCKPAVVAVICDLDMDEAQGYRHRIDGYTRSETVCCVAAEMLGLDYRSVYRAMDRGDIKSKQDGGTRVIEMKNLRLFCRDYLNRDGLRKARYLLFAGVNPEIAAFRAGVERPAIRGLLRELRESDVGPKSQGPYSLVQTGKILDIEPRLVRRYCQEGRLGREVPSDDALEYGIRTKYLITRDDILAFGSKHRQVGRPGQVARQHERANGSHSKNGSRKHARS